MKKIITLIMILLPALVFSAWITLTNTSNGVTAVTVVTSPASGYSRTVPANAGILVFNTSLITNVAFYIEAVDSGVTSQLDYVELSTNKLYINDWVNIISTNTAVIQLRGTTAFGSVLSINTHYRDEAQ